MIKFLYLKANFIRKSIGKSKYDFWQEKTRGPKSAPTKSKIMIIKNSF